MASRTSKDVHLRHWQELALDRWFAAGKRGIVKVVTGAGKTALALAIAARAINIVSLSMQSGGTNGAGAYAVAKGALHIFTRTLARELGPAVRANAICLGVIETAHHVGCTPPEKLEEYRQSSLLKRNGQAREIAL